MKYTIMILLIFAVFSFGQITGLEGWDLYLDPGHSQRENMGIYGYSEAERNLRVGLRLREMLLNETDIDTVFICRTNDSQQVSLSQRTSQANSLGASWYHSIHSDAGGSTSNSTLLLHGGWRENGQTIEKTPHGGKEMSDYMVDLLSRGMRIGTRGNYADRTFYQGFPENHDNKYPYLHVNRESYMTSELSEAGFHTNPTQNQLFMNADWKRLEARTYFWSILKYHQIPRPVVRILTGIVKDAETNIPLNGAEIKVGERTYITDTFESLFYNYTDDPDLLHNGLYYFEDIEGTEVEIIAHAEGYYSDTVTVSMADDFFTFRDFGLGSKKIPTIVSTVPAEGDTNYSVLDDIVIQFNRPMNPDTVLAHLIIDPPVTARFMWSDSDRKLEIRPDQLAFKTTYTLTISGTVTDNYGHPLDGDGDGTGGDDFVLQFKTGFDNVPPVLTQYYPRMNASGVERRPIIRLEYDEKLSLESVTSDVIKLERFSNHSWVSGTFFINEFDKRNVVHFIPDEDLYPDEIYVTRIYAGISDQLGNESVNAYALTFITGTYDFEIVNIDHFDGGISNWWAPDASGSTTGIKPGTQYGAESTIVNPIQNSGQSLRLKYEWDTGADAWLIREYLGGESPRNIFFTNEFILQAYVYGDGSGNRFRFAVDDRVPESAAGNHEVSPWFSIDWLGWKLVSWDMSKDGTGTWLGDGSLDGTLRFDSIQLTYTEGATDTGTVYFDNLRVVKKVPATAIEEMANYNVPENYYLNQNYPNPFNGSTMIQFGVPHTAQVRIDIYNTLGQHIARVFEGVKTAGHHTVSYDASDLSSGLYIYNMHVGAHVAAKTMLLIK